MKIVSVDFNPLGYAGGISSFNRNLYKIFGNNIFFISFYKNKQIYKIDDALKFDGFFRKNILLKIINYLSNYRLSSFLVCKYLERLDADKVIFNSPSFLRYYKGNADIYLVQHQDVDIMMNNKSNFGNDLGLIDKCKTMVKCFIVLSDLDKDKLISRIGISEDKVVVIRHTVSFDPLQYPRDNNQKRIVMISRLDNNQKRFDLVINSMKFLSDYELNIYGSGKDKKLLEKLILKNKLTNVTLCGYTNNVADALDKNDIYVMSSDFEGYGITNIEAMTRGLPIILRDTYTGASDIIDGNGILLGSKWSCDDFCQAVANISDNYKKYSLGSVLASKKYSFNLFKESWMRVINDEYSL